MTAKRYRELRAMSIEQLIGDYDTLAANANLGLAFYRDELARREQAKETKTMVWLTWVVTILTFINAVLVAVTLKGS